MGFFIFVGAVVTAVLAIIINSYNDLVKYRNRYKNAYAQINVQLQRRYDKIQLHRINLVRLFPFFLLKAK